MQIAKKVLAVFLAVLFVLPGLGVGLTASAALGSGQCGVNASYKFSRGTLTISGSDATYDYDLTDQNVSPFNAEQRIKTVVVSDGIMALGDYIFCSCSNMTSVSLPNSLFRIGSHAFAGCVALENISIPDGVRNIDTRAFSNCGLRSVTLPKSVEEISSETFYNCPDLTTVNYTGGPADWNKIEMGSDVFYGTQVTGPTCYYYGVEGATNAINDIGAVEYSDACKARIDAARAAYDALSDADKALVSNAGDLTAAEQKYAQLEAQATELANGGTCGTGVTYTFDKSTCTLTVSGNGYIFFSAFSAHDRFDVIRHVVIEQGVIGIFDQAFRGCTGLQSVTIPKSVTQIGMFAFAGCSSLTAVYFTGSEAQWRAVRKSSDAFKGTPDTLKVYYYYGVEGAANAINDVGDVEYNPECKARIDAARAAYDALSDEDKAKVTNAADLLAAEAKYAALESRTDTGKALQLSDGCVVPNVLGAQQSNVWFGNYMQSSADSKEPVKWRVLSNADGKLFLLADQNLDVVRYNEEETGVTWADCTLRKWLNGYENHPYDDTFIGNAFSEQELNAVADSEVENADNPSYNTPGGNGTTDKVFLLSIAEAKNTDYGFTDNYDDTDKRVSTNTQYVANGGHTGGGMNGIGGADYWWLRSPGNYGTYAAIVLDGGYLYDDGCDVLDFVVAVRPAFKMNLNSVLFTSAAENGKQGDGALTAVGDYTGSDWKLTLLDDSRDFTATQTASGGSATVTNGYNTGSVTNGTNGTDAQPQTAVTASAGETLSFDYTGATVGENEYISAILTDEDGVVLYYGRLTQPTDAAGTVAVAIPADLADGSYTLKVFSEQYNGDYKTDLASAPVDVPLTVETTTVTPDMRVDVNEAVYGEDTVITVTMPADATGSVCIELTKNNVTTYILVPLNDGKAEYQIKLNAGSYTAVVTYAGWDQYSEAEKKIEFTVEKAPTELAVTTSPDKIVYGDTLQVTATLSGGTVFSANQIDEQTGNPADGPGAVIITVDNKQYRTVSADPDDVAIVVRGNVATLEVTGLNAGQHEIEAVFVESDNYARSTASATIEIGKKKIQEPTPIENLAYTGERQVGVNYDESLSNVAFEIGFGSRVAATDAGTYGCTFRIKNNNYQWANTSEAIVQFSWSIGKVTVEKPVAKENLEWTGEEQIGVVYDESKGYTLESGSVSGTDADTYSATFALNDTKNYQWADGSTDPVTVNWSIGCKHVWKEPEWDWTQDVNNPTYTAQCNNCTDTATGTVQSDEGERVEATVDEDAYTPYTAEVTLGEQTFTDTFKAYEPGTAFEAYKQAQKKAAGERALDSDSDEAAALIEAAKKAIDDVQFNENNTLQQNKDAVDEAANLAGLEKALTDQRAADAVEDLIDAIGNVELTDESKQKIDDAREAYNDLTDEQKDLVDNFDTLTDAEDEYELLDNHAQFEDYKEAQKKAAGDKALPGDSAECAQLIADAIDAINDVTYDETQSLQQNKDAVDEAANLAQLDADLAEHRAIHYAKFYADGKPVESVPYTIDTKSITEPAVPEKTGYTGAWPSYTLKAGGVRIDAVYETIPYDAEFYADGVLVDTVTYNVETTSIADKEPAVPEKPGHTGAWPDYTLKVGGTRIDAVYEVIMQTVDFDANGGKGEMQSVTTAWGSKITLPECTFTAPNGKEFDKWDAGDPGDEIEVKSDLTVKAVWKEKPLTLTADVDPTQTGERIKITVPYAKRGGIAATLTASEEGVRYESSKPGVISVDENGVIRLEKLCLFCKTATITAYSADGQKVASCVVNVRHAWWQYIIWFFFGSFWF